MRLARTRPRRVALALGAAWAGVALAVPLADAPVRAQAPTPGGVFVSGHDADKHAGNPGGSPGAQNIVRRAIAYATNAKANPRVLLVAEPENCTTSPQASNPRNGMRDSGFSYQVADYGSGQAHNLTTVNFADYDVIVVANSSRGWVRQRDIEVLKARKGELDQFLSLGGGLVAFSTGGPDHCPATEPFGYLPCLRSQGLGQEEDAFRLTDAGRAMGLTTADVRANQSHSIFLDPAGMEVATVDGEGRIISLVGRGPQCLQLTIGDTSVQESNSGTTLASFTVELDHPSSGGVSVDYATADGTAVAGADYTSKSGTLVFGPGVSSKTIVVPVVGDTVEEPTETFTVALSNPAGTAIAKATGVGTILDDDAPPERAALSITDVSLTEPNAGTALATFTVALSGPLPTTVTVDYATADASAHAGPDYLARAGTLSFPAGTLVRKVPVPVVGDVVPEATEAFTVSLTNAAGAPTARPQGVGTILDSDRIPPADADPARGTSIDEPEVVEPAPPVVQAQTQPVSQAQSQSQAQQQSQQQAQSQAAQQAQTQAAQQAQTQAAQQAQTQATQQAQSAQQQVQQAAQAQAQTTQQVAVHQQAQTQTASQAQTVTQAQSAAQAQPAVFVERQREIQVEVERLGGGRGPAQPLLASRRSPAPAPGLAVVWGAAVLAPVLLAYQAGALAAAAVPRRRRAARPAYGDRSSKGGCW